MVPAANVVGNGKNPTTMMIPGGCGWENVVFLSSGLAAVGSVAGCLVSPLFGCWTVPLAGTTIVNSFNDLHECHCDNDHYQPRYEKRWCPQPGAM